MPQQEEMIDSWWQLLKNKNKKMEHTSNLFIAT